MILPSSNASNGHFPPSPNSMSRRSQREGGTSSKPKPVRLGVWYEQTGALAALKFDQDELEQRLNGRGGGTIVGAARPITI